VKKYEGLFILNTAGKEENVKELIDKVDFTAGRVIIDPPDGLLDL